MRSIVCRRSTSARSFSFNGSRRNTDTPERHGAAQPNRFDPARAARLDDPARFAYLPPLEIVRLLDLKPGARLIDYGTGTGTYALEIARARPDVAIFALDEQAEMLDQARANFAAAGFANVDAIDTARLAALRGSVDRIFALNVLHELGDRALAGLGSLLQPGGFALIVDWNADVARPVGPPSAHVYGPARARERVEAHGLNVRDTALFAYHYALTCVAAGIA
jgi:SAM-dependent methyltransferase